MHHYSHFLQAQIACFSVRRVKFERDRLLSLEKKDGAMTEVEVDKMLCLVGDEGSEVTADNAVPSRSLAFIELALLACVLGVGGGALEAYCLLDVHGNVLLRECQL